jgi:hypothetical protein
MPSVLANSIISSKRSRPNSSQRKNSYNLPRLNWPLVMPRFSASSARVLLGKSGIVNCSAKYAFKALHNVQITKSPQYDRIDPAEVQALKDEIEVLKAEKENIQQSVAVKDEQLVNQTQRASWTCYNGTFVTYTGLYRSRRLKPVFANTRK